MTCPRSRPRELAFLLALLTIAMAVRLPGVFSRSIWYDEAISLLTAAGNAQPAWPRNPEPAAHAQALFRGHPSVSQLIADVRRYDVHPPGYYWALGLWNRAFGFSLESARVFSLIASLGAVMAFYLLLRATGVAGALPMALVYALSTGAAHSGHEARAFALASWLLLTGAWLALRAPDLAPRDRRRAAASSLVVATACGLAFHVNYLTVFPAAALLGWFAVFLWRASPPLALATPALAALIGALGVPTLLEQLDKRPDQLAGFVGYGPELAKLFTLNVQMMGLPLAEDSGLARRAVVVGIFAALLGLTAVAVYRRRSTASCALGTLVVALAIAPSAGIFLLDLAFDKRLHVSRYLNFAGPALAVAMSYGLVALLGSRRRVFGVVLLGGLLAIQASNLNWGLEVCPNSEFGGTSRSLARLIRSTSSPGHLVVVADGYNRAGNPGHVIYELDPTDEILTFGNTTDLDRVMANIAAYDDVWLVFSLDGGTLGTENELLRRLEASGHYRGIYRDGITFHMMNTQARDRHRSAAPSTGQATR